METRRFGRLGAACAGAVYGTLAALGFAALALYLQPVEVFLQGLAGMFIAYLGYRALNQPLQVTPRSETQDSNASLGPFISTFALTLANPMTIMTFMAIFSSLKIATSTVKYSSTQAVWVV